MSDTPYPPCKSTMKDGSPCQGRGLPQFDGYCIGHAPAVKRRPRRALGDTNASTAARAEECIPQPLRTAIQALNRGIDEVLAGNLDPAALDAISQGVTTLLRIYQLADQEEEAAAADPRTGQSLDQPPDGIRTGPNHTPKPGETRTTAEILQDQLRQLDALSRAIRKKYEDELDERADLNDWDKLLRP